MAKSWYAYLGNGSPLSVVNYAVTSIDPNCLDGCSICAIFTNGNSIPTSPFSKNMQTYISNALTNFQAQPQSRGTKKYVYLKSC